MKILESKTIAILIAVFITLSMAGSMILLPSANAHSPAWQVPTYSFCSVSPNPIGIGQTVNVNFWVNIPPPTANQQFGDRWQNMTVVVTHPDGTTEKLGPFTSDDTGGSHTTYTPNSLGNYTFQMIFGGQTLAGANPSLTGTTSVFVGDYFQPSQSNVFKLTVQQQAITYAGVSPLPTNYWTRPIYAENTNWYSIAGNWLGLGISTFANTGMYNASANYNAYTNAPNTAHILWTKPAAWGGIIGGEFGGSEISNYYSTSQYEPKFAPIIMQGVLYYTLYPGASSYPEGWVAVDLHTGQTLWTKNTTEILRCGQLLQMVTPNQYGALAYLWSNPVGNLTAGSSRPGVLGSLEMWDAMTGNYILTITGVQTMTLTEDNQGDLIGYYTNNTGTSQSLTMWNSTLCINLNIPSSNNNGVPLADNWYWRPGTGAQMPFAKGIQWSVPLPNNISGVPLVSPSSGLLGLSVSAINSNTVLLVEALSGITNAGYQAGWQIETGYNAATGAQLWAPINRTETPFSIIYTGSVWAGSGAYVELTESTLSIAGYSLTTGQQLWGPIALPNVSPFSSLGANAVVANGSIYIWGYGGDVYSFNIVTGALNWQYHTPSGGYESPYGVEPIWTFTVGTVADGKLFVPEGHMYSPPLFHNAQQLALNTTDGNLVWSIDAFDVTSAPAISDGVMTTLNAYDNQIYAYGKGATKVTVTAPGVGITTSTPVTISGSVTDISAGATQQAVAANFPNGLPAVSDTSMTNWMEYVYMQQPFPANTTGVPISIDVIDSNGNYRNIGSTTSDASGKFSFTWTPDIAGHYTVVASFHGSESYYSSYDEAFFTASASPTASPIATSEPASMADTYLIPSVVAIIVVIIIVGAVLALMIRKQP